jgi:hypothetical protein
MPKRSSWLKNADAVAHVKRELLRSGIPLELKAWARAVEFCDAVATNDKTATVERIVYGLPTQEQALREVDLCVQLYEEFAISAHTGVQLVVKVPVECKARDSVETFGFPTPASSWLEGASYPVYTHFIGSDLALAVSRAMPGDLRPKVLSTVGIEFKKGQNRAKGDSARVHKESVVYNAAASLYDYVRSSTEEVEPPSRPDPRVEDAVNDFEAYLREKHFAWWSVLHRWKRENIATQLAKEYERRSDGGTLYWSVVVYLPTICLDGPIYVVSMSPAGSPQAFRNASHFVTHQRVPGWPFWAKGRMMKPGPEAPAIVTNEDGLRAVLDLASQWFDAIKQAMTNSDPDTIARAAYEADFCRHVRAAHADEDRSVFVSEFDIERYA